MDAMSDTDPTSRAMTADPQALPRVATLVRAATRLANTAAGTDLRSPWLDVVAETVTAAGYLTDVPNLDASDTGLEDGGSPRDVGAQALAALEHAAGALDQAGGRRDHRVVLLRAALTDAITTARRIPS